MGNYLMQSVFELLETVLSYLSNTISFLRVGAFVIVHASMMMVVFTLAGTPNNMLVVILGNIVVICLEALLSAIQGIRLEFYEMFSRCYKGGGRRSLPRLISKGVNIRICLQGRMLASARGSMRASTPRHRGISQKKNHGGYSYEKQIQQAVRYHSAGCGCDLLRRFRRPGC